MVTAVRPPQDSSAEMAAQSSASMALAGEASATVVRGSTGHRAPQTGQRFPDDARQEARRRGVRPSGTHAHGHQPHGPSAQEPFPRIVGQQLLADDLLRAIAGLRIGQGVIVDDRGQRLLPRPPEHGDRAREHHHRIRPERTASREQRLGGAQVRADTQIEVRFAFRADGRGKMEDHLGSGERVGTGAGIQQLSDVAADRRHPRVGYQIRWNRRLVDERHPGQRTWTTARHVERARRQ
jgi:hypothetical protein